MMLQSVSSPVPCPNLGPWPRSYQRSSPLWTPKTNKILARQIRALSILVERNVPCDYGAGLKATATLDQLPVGRPEYMGCQVTETGEVLVVK